MGNKVHPTGFRLGITTEWQSRWFGSKKLYREQLRKDVEIRQFIMKRWKAAALASVIVERSANVIRLSLHTSRPGVLIGRGGTGIEDLTRVIKKRFFAGKKVELKVEVQEVKNAELNAMLVGQQVAEQLEKRMPFRRVLKGMLDQVEGNKEAQGVKIEISGRLGGAEMGRVETYREGRVPLHTLRADVDFGLAEARTTYGTIGVKVWIFKGEVLQRKARRIPE
jgi:small subunit ribosomal protein S3